MPPMHEMAEPGDAQVPGQSAKTRADSITLILTETTANSKSDIPSRTFELSSDNKKIVIGRSSKTISKGLIPAANNGYFDSPVVSREHATIEADLEKGVVRVTDAQSLHGTSVNGNRLEAGVPLTLSNGDKLRFGAHVARALDIFYPTDCQIKIVCHQQEDAPVVERARSYCAPESVDDTSDSDSSDEYDSQTDEPSPGESLMECDSPTQSGGIQLLADKSDAVPTTSLTHAMLVDDDSINEDEDEDEGSYVYDSEDGSNVESDEELDETSNEDEDEGEDEDENENENENEDLNVDEADGEAEEDYGEDDEGSEDADDDELNSGLQDLQDLDNGLAEALGEIFETGEVVEDAEDDGGAFLEQEIRQFMEKANQQGKIPDKKLQAQEPEVAHDESASEPVAAPCVSHQEEAHDTVMKDVSDAKSTTRPITPITAAATSAGNKKIDIPSILNPSPSSGLLSSAAESMPMRHSFAYAIDPNNTAKAEAASAGTSAYASHQQAFTQLEPLSYAAEEAAAWRMPAFVTHVPAVKATPAPVAVVAPATPATPKEAVCGATQAKTAMKRKMDDVAAEDVQILAQTMSVSALTHTPEHTATVQAMSQAMSQAMLTPPAEDGHASKRQAKSLAVAAKSESETRSKAWAAVEKIGIAALGGAVVLGSLIYTAPTF